jgi:hypothetical protein
MAQEQFTIGTAVGAVPTGWTEKAKSEERIILRSPDSRQQATISILRFGKDASFEDFKSLCKHRLDAENRELVNGFIKADDPFNDKGFFGMFFSGGDKKNGRVFSGYLSLVNKELITVYVEGISVAPAENLKTFKAFVTGLKRK